MPIRGLGPQQYPPFVNGFDDSSVLDSRETRGTLSRAWNTDLVSDSICKKRNGYVAQMDSWGDMFVRAGLEYKGTDGTKQVLIYGEGVPSGGSFQKQIFAKFTGTSTPVSYAQSSTYLAIPGTKPSIIQIRNLAMFFGGKIPRLYDGSGVRQIGIDPPTSEAVLLRSITGHLTQFGNYLWTYTYYNSATGAESSPAPSSRSYPIGDVTNSGYRLTISAGTSSTAATADTIRLYRTVNGGSVFFFDSATPLANYPGYCESTVSDAGLGNELELDNSRLFSDPKYAVVNDARVFVAGFDNNPNRIQYSKVGINGPMPESFQVADFIDCSLNDGDKIVGLGKSSAGVVVLKENSVGRLISIQGNFGGLQRAGSQKYIYQEISNNITGISHHTIISLDGFVIWLGKDEIYGTDGSQIFRFGKRISNTLNNINWTQEHKFSAINKTDSKQIIFSVCRKGQNEPDMQLVGHYDNFPQIAFTIYKPGNNAVTHPGLQAASLFEVTVDGRRKVWFGSSAEDGLVHQMDTGSNDNGNGIYWDVRFPWDGFEFAASRKMFHSYYVFASGTGQSPNNTLVHTFEADKDETIIETATSILNSSGSNWSEVNWGEFDWSSISFSPFVFSPHISAYFGRYGFNNIFADQPVAVMATAKVGSPRQVHF